MMSVFINKRCRIDNYFLFFCKKIRKAQLLLNKSETKFKQMKKILLLFTLLTAIFFVAKAQNPISLSWDGEELGDTLIVFGAPNNLGELTAHAIVHNNTDNGMNIVAARNNIDVIGGTENSFCWVTCWSSTVDTSDGYVFIPAGGQSNEEEFSGHYTYSDLEGNIHYGTSIVKYSFFNKDDFNVIATLYVKYMLGYEGVDNEGYKGAKFTDIYPNPASTKAVLNYKLPNSVKSGEVKIINLVGKTLKTIPITNREGKISIDVSDLSQGIYFYAINLDGVTVKTKKLIIKK